MYDLSCRLCHLHDRCKAQVAGKVTKAQQHGAKMIVKGAFFLKHPSSITQV